MFLCVQSRLSKLWSLPRSTLCSASVTAWLSARAQARRSTHRFASAEQEWGSLIYKYTTSLEYAPAFEQVYFFEY